MNRITLICLPYAGGGAGVFRGWQRALPAWLQVVPLHLPGRDEQIGQAAVHDWPALIEMLMREVEPHLAQPFAIFGHSMGALIGFELAHEIRRRHQIEPRLFVASSCLAPARRAPDPSWLDCDEDRLLAEVRKLGGTPEALLEDLEFRQMLLPMLRADFHLCGTYVSRPRPRLTSPLLALLGSEDRVAERLDDVVAWSEESTGAFSLERIPGGHLFINESRAAVLDLIVAALTATARRQPTLQAIG